ncbi:hypothetical protein E8E14_000995 [Neopestalotiopsis sp. 37M]|nr:hypothetical protein E8E14_000995 [Neopestalotiopsis sp. 37M]
MTNEITETSNVCSESDGHDSPQDPIERRKAQNRAAQRNHRKNMQILISVPEALWLTIAGKRMKRRLEQLEKRLDSQGTSPNQLQQRSSQLTPNYASGTTLARQYTDFADLELTTGDVGPFTSDVPEAFRLMDPIFYSEVTCASTDNLKLTSFNEIPTLQSWAERAGPYASVGIYDHESSFSLEEQINLFENIELSSPSLGLDSSISASTVATTPPWQDDAHAASAEERMSRVIEFVQAIGFRDLDALATEYYVGKFDEASYISAAQRTSRSRQLRGLLERLRTSSQSWSEYEVRDYRHEISQSAESLYVAELDKFRRNVENSAGGTSVTEANPNSAALPRLDPDVPLSIEAHAMQNKVSVFRAFRTSQPKHFVGVK